MKKTIKLFQKNVNYLVFFILIIVISAEIITLIDFKLGSSRTTLSIEEYAKQVIEKCKNENYKPSCYDKIIPQLMEKPVNMSMEDAFRLTSLVQETDTSYKYCHVLGHALAAQEVKKDPSKWKEVVARIPSGICSNGGIHGGFQERFRTDHFVSEKEINALIPDLKIICEKKESWNPTGLEQASCYHALGHLTMYITNADIDKSISICNVIAKKNGGIDYTQLCYDGVFMQIFQPLEPEDLALIKGKAPTKENLLLFCNKFTGAQRGSCITESWPLFHDLFSSSKNIVQFCSMENSDQIDRCYHAITYVMVPMLNLDSSKITPMCNSFPEKRIAVCFADVAARLIEIDYRNIHQAINVCKEAGNFGDLCFQNLIYNAKFNFHSGSIQNIDLCNTMPDSWKNKCIDFNSLKK